ncbi:MauE/DoxX family redox-associated membrane protein [Flavobacterium sp. JP2137]|uniref:MauE/DoxX family redox-associated membrane protein n=1 Tax=Flavobacterium sp. JP2137 TaxID=3414510 RepID=UPI003D2FED2F
MRTILSISKQVIIYFFIILFVYAALSKILDFENFQIQVAQSPLLSAYATLITYITIISELIIAFLLCFPKTIKLGLYLFLGMMTAFSVYIYLILNFSPFVPCSCGGILEKMGWQEHLWFNIIITLIAVIILVFTPKNIEGKAKSQDQKQTLILSVLTIIVSSVIVVGLFLQSEHIIKKENPFVRRFLPHPIDKAQYLDLEVNSYYIAGLTKDTIYIGNYTAPLFIKAISTDMQNIVEHTIKLDETKRFFRNLTIRIQNKTVFVSDGTVPIIYKGSVSDWKTKKYMQTKIYFSLVQPLSDSIFLFRSQYAKNGEHVLGQLKISPNNDSAFELYENILQKQIDGLFDTDGQLVVDTKTNQGIYTYYYRNQYMVYHPKINIFSSGKTIDTTSVALIQVTKLANGERKMNAPALKVNNKIYAYSGLLYVNCGLLGQNEPKSMWNQASIIDVYDYNKQEYRYSFYIYDYNRDKVREFALNDDYFFGLVGNSLVRYQRIIK